MNFLDSFSYFSGLGAVLLFLLGLLVLVFRKKEKVRVFVLSNAPSLVLMVSFLGVVGSLIYSDVLLLEPCRFCWYQRIVMYPIPVLIALAMYRKEPIKIMPYTLFLSVAGMIMAFYHYLLQTVPAIKNAENAPFQCGTYGPSCTEAYVEVFGFLSIPLMSVAMFFFLVVVTSVYLKIHKDNRL